MSAGIEHPLIDTPHAFGVLTHSAHPVDRAEPLPEAAPPVDRPERLPEPLTGVLAHPVPPFDRAEPLSEVSEAPVVPADVWRPTQVHGARVVRVEEVCAPGELQRAPKASAHLHDLGEADAVLCTTAGCAVGVESADCVPILAQAGTRAVLAIHAGWRGLAAGVIEQAVAALEAVAEGAKLRAVIGPCARGCCYEVDTPVLAALGARYEDALPAVSTPTRLGHARVDLAMLAESALHRAAQMPIRCAVLPDACSICDPRFESHRRDGPRAARMLHWLRLPADS